MLLLWEKVRMWEHAYKDFPRQCRGTVTVLQADLKKLKLIRQGDPQYLTNEVRKKKHTFENIILRCLWI